jgi:hypothetical protein
MSSLLFLVEALGLLGPLRWNSDTTCEYYTRDVYASHGRANDNLSSLNNATPVCFVAV